MMAIDIATAGSANGGLAVVLWDAATGAPRKTFPWPLGDSISAPAFSPDGKRVAAAGGKHLKVWDVEGGQEVFADDDPTRHAQAVAFTPDGKTLVFASNRNAAKTGDTNIFIADWVE